MPRVLGRRIRDDERGVVIVVVAIFMTVAVASAALALDLGNAWQLQARLHTATDAAALAAADTYGAGSAGCSTVANTYVTSNDSAATMTSCTPVTSGSSSSGYVVVKATETVQFNFAAVFGKSSQDVHSTSAVQWGPPKGASNVRPIGLCLYDTRLSSWLNLPNGPTGTSNAITVPLSNSNAECSSNSNWGWLDLSGSGGGSDVNNWLDTGYPQLLGVPSNINAETGHLSSVQQHLATLKANGTQFPIAMYDTISGSASSQLYHVVAFTIVQLLDYNVTGTPSQQYFTFKFFRSAISGTCCGTGPNTGAIVSAACATSDPKTGQCGL